MQTIKGIAILLLSAVAVFMAVRVFNNLTEPAYVVKSERATLAVTDHPAKTAPVKQSSGTTAHIKATNSNL